MKYLPRLVILALMMPGCVLRCPMLQTAAAGRRWRSAFTDVGIARPSVDASVEPPADAGAARPYDAGPRGEVPTCGEQQRLDEDSHLCVPLSGTTSTCRDAAALRRDHRWLRDAQSVLCGAAGSR